jgi:hypothetical protein
MYLFFIDDAKQNTPTRIGMGPINTVGGIIVSCDQVKKLEQEIERLCDAFGFPPKEKFKWSPGRELWMRENLVAGRRQKFFINVLNALAEHGVKTIVVSEDTNCCTAIIKCKTADEDVICMFMERAERFLRRHRSEGIIVADRPGGGRMDEDSYLLNTLESIQEGTSYVRIKNIILNVLSTPSKYIRLLQAADLVVSCTTARICGESEHSMPVFQAVKSIFDSDQSRIGGIGLKIHPDFKYANLYHWLVGDAIYYKGWFGKPLPMDDYPYSISSCEY